jgi:hypothetical protein
VPRTVGTHAAACVTRKTTQNLKDLSTIRTALLQNSLERFGQTCASARGTSIFQSTSECALSHLHFLALAVNINYR